jgi:hypothetical protein
MHSDPNFSVTHLTLRRGSTELAIGSGFIYERNSELFLVTAWHNVTGRHSETLKLISKTLAIPDNLVAIIPQLTTYSGGTSAVRMPYTIPLESDDQVHYWTHPKGWPRVDVAVVPLDLNAFYKQEIRAGMGDMRNIEGRLRTNSSVGASLDIQPIQHCLGSFSRVASGVEEHTMEGDELFVLGYPQGVSDFFSSPIWKRATIAAYPQRGWNGQPLFLVDCASRPGMSGGPVIAFEKSGRVRLGAMEFQGSEPSTWLHGVYVGRLPNPDATTEGRLFEAQIGQVWKRQVIDEIIDARQVALHSSDIGVGSSRIASAVIKKWSGVEGYHLKVLAMPDSGWLMTGVVMEHLNGNANLQDVYTAVLAHARSLRDEGAENQSQTGVE